MELHIRARHPDEAYYSFITTLSKELAMKHQSEIESILYKIFTRLSVQNSVTKEAIDLLNGNGEIDDLKKYHRSVSARKIGMHLLEKRMLSIFKGINPYGETEELFMIVPKINIEQVGIIGDTFLGGGE